MLTLSPENFLALCLTWAHYAVLSKSLLIRSIVLFSYSVWFATCTPAAIADDAVLSTLVTMLFNVPNTSFIGYFWSFSTAIA